VVKRIPERMNQTEARKFLRDVEPLINSDRPPTCIRSLPGAAAGCRGIEVLLQCMSQVMKRDGDLKLASLSDHAASSWS